MVDTLMINVMDHYHYSFTNLGRKAELAYKNFKLYRVNVDGKHCRLNKPALLLKTMIIAKMKTQTKRFHPNN